MNLGLRDLEIVQCLICRVAQFNGFFPFFNDFLCQSIGMLPQLGIGVVKLLLAQRQQAFCGQSCAAFTCEFRLEIHT